jgi:hypothetical protein
MLKFFTETAKRKASNNTPSAFKKLQTFQQLSNLTLNKEQKTEWFKLSEDTQNQLISCVSSEIPSQFGSVGLNLSKVKTTWNKGGKLAIDLLAQKLCISDEDKNRILHKLTNRTFGSNALDYMQLHEIANVFTCFSKGGKLKELAENAINRWSYGGELSNDILSYVLKNADSMDKINFIIKNINQLNVYNTAKLNAILTAITNNALFKIMREDITAWMSKPTEELEVYIKIFDKNEDLGELLANNPDAQERIHDNAHGMNKMDDKTFNVKLDHLKRIELYGN